MAPLKYSYHVIICFYLLGMMLFKSGFLWFLLIGFLVLLAVVIMSTVPASVHKQLNFPALRKGESSATVNYESNSITSRITSQIASKQPVMKKDFGIKPLDPYFNVQFPVSKSLVLFDAFFDSRGRNSHENITMIFLVASKVMFEQKKVTGCGVGDTVANAFNLRYVQEDHLMHGWLGKNKFKYEQLALECYDVPVTPGERAFVIFNAGQNETAVIHTANPVVFPAPRVTPSGPHNFSVLVCTKVHNKGVSWFPEFLRYQKTLGVDHIHLQVLDKFITDEGFQDSVAKDSFFVKLHKEKFMSLQLWNEWYNDEDWYVHGTILMYLDCLYRFRGTYDFITLMDTDDFFTVRAPGMTYKDMIAKYCMGATTGSCSFKWLWYFPGICGMAGKVAKDGNVTAAIKFHQPEDTQGNLKSIHRSTAVLDSSFHDARCDTCLLEGYKVVHVPPHIAYAAHQRLYWGNEKKYRCSINHW